MKSCLHETLLNILFLSCLVCILGSVVRKDTMYNEQPSTWQKARDYCRWTVGDWALLTQQSEVDTIRTISHLTWIGLKKEFLEWMWSDGTPYFYSENDWSSTPTLGECAFITSTSEKFVSTSCSRNLFFYCYGGTSESPVTFVPWAMTWKNAQAYCRKNHIDLVTLSTPQFQDLPNDDLFYVWTGIHRTEPGGDWKSSVGNSHYENWEEGKPTEDGDCVGISSTDKKMTNLDCTSAWPFYCFTNNLVLVKENKTWEEALEHCRAMDLADPSLLRFNNHHNDLISISDTLDQLTVWSMIHEATTDEVWTGLRYLVHSWFWVDGTYVPYQDLPHCPDLGQYCGTLVRDNSTIDWNIRNCTEKRNFLCYRKSY